LTKDLTAKLATQAHTLCPMKHMPTKNMVKSAYLNNSHKKMNKNETHADEEHMVKSAYLNNSHKKMNKNEAHADEEHGEVGISE
jgi:hypothetical protein